MIPSPATADPPRHPMRIYGQLLRDGVVIDESNPAFAGTVISAWWQPAGTAPVELTRTTLVAGTPRRHRYLLHIGVGNGTLAPAPGSTIEIHVGPDSVA